MKKNWKKLLSVLLLSALLCALPGTLAWATDISAITPDGPAGNQVVEDQTGGSQTGGTGSDGTGSGTSTGTDTTGGDSGNTGSGTSTEGSGATSGDTGGAGTGTGSGAGTTGDTGTSGSQTSGYHHRSERFRFRFNRSNGGHPNTDCNSDSNYNAHSDPYSVQTCHNKGSNG